MKKILTIICMACLALVSCNKDQSETAGSALGIKVFSPLRVAPGGTVTITGAGLDKVNVVTLAGVDAAEIRKVSSNMLYVTVPASASAATGKLVVKTADAEVDEAAKEVSIVIPTVTAINPVDKVDGGSEMFIFGTDLDAIEEAVFPGGFVLKSIAFQRRSSKQIRLIVPEKVPTGEATVVLKTAGGATLETPALQFIKKRTGHYEEKEIVLYSKSGGRVITYSDTKKVERVWYDNWHVGMVLKAYIHQVAGEKYEVCIKKYKSDGTGQEDYKIPEFGNSAYFKPKETPTVISIEVTEKFWNDCFAEGKGSNDGKYLFRYSGEGYALDKLVTTDNVWVWDDEE